MAEKEGIGKAKAVTLNIKNSWSIAGTTVTPTAADLNTLAGVSSVSGSAILRVVKVAANGGTDTGGGIVSWVNPEVGAIVINRATLDVTTIATGACTVSIGTTASSATTLSANLLTGLDTHSATGTFDNLANPGGSGKQLQKLAAGGWVTASKASGASAGMIANLYIEYFLV
jgi:hypothetical protein